LLAQIGNRQIKKRIHVRVEHVQPSRCRDDFLQRRTANDIKKAAAKKIGGARPRATAETLQP
jgi:large subunit ribosomal protein L21e